MSRRIKSIIQIILMLTVVVLCIVGLGRDVFHAFEELFYDHEATLFSSNAVSKLTNQINLFAGSLSLFLIPFYFVALFDENHRLTKVTYTLKFICTVLLIFLILLVVCVLFPLTCATNGFEVGFRSNFLGDCLYSHVLIPILFITSFFALDEKQELMKRTQFIVLVIFLVYVISYIFFVYVFKTWEDFYFINEAAKVVSYFAIIPVVLIVLLGVYFGTKFLAKIASK